MHAYALYLYRLCVVLFIIEFQKFISVFLNNREKNSFYHAGTIYVYWETMRIFR